MSDWFPTNGKPPRNPDQAYWLKFRNGMESKYSYTKSQMRWDHNGSPFDIIEARKA